MIQNHRNRRLRSISFEGTSKPRVFDQEFKFDYQSCGDESELMCNS